MSSYVNFYNLSVRCTKKLLHYRTEQNVQVIDQTNHVINDFFHTCVNISDSVYAGSVTKW